MERIRLSASLLNGKFLHCRPVEGGAVVEARILPTQAGDMPAKVAIYCEARRPCSKCELRIQAGRKDDYCHYYRGDSLGDYQIIGPNADKKSDSGLGG